MRKEQKIVAVGAASGVIIMLASVYLLSRVMPGTAFGAGAGERLVFAAKWIAVAAAPLFVMLAAVGNARFNSDAIDPTAGRESEAMKIDGRVADNTLQQFVCFTAASLAVAASASGPEMSLIAAAASFFVVARVAFWTGYRIHPLFRAPGMAATSYLNLLLFGIALWMAWR